MGMSRQELKTMLGEKKAKKALGEEDLPADRRKPEDKEGAVVREALKEINNGLIHAYPELIGLFAIPNGGDRNPVVGKKLKVEGVKRGVPDFCLPIPRGGYSALYIEVKAEDGKCSDEQIEWQGFLQAHGNKAVVAWGKQEIIDTLIWYLTLSSKF